MTRVTAQHIVTHVTYFDYVFLYQKYWLRSTNVCSSAYKYIIRTTTNIQDYGMLWVFVKIMKQQGCFCDSRDARFRVF